MKKHFVLGVQTPGYAQPVVAGVAHVSYPVGTVIVYEEMLFKDHTYWLKVHQAEESMAYLKIGCDTNEGPMFWGRFVSFADAPVKS